MPSAANFMRTVHIKKTPDEAATYIQHEIKDSREREGAFLVVPFHRKENVKFVILVGLTGCSKIPENHPVKCLYVRVENGIYTLEDAAGMETPRVDKLFDLIDWYVKGGNGADSLAKLHQIHGYTAQYGTKESANKTTLELRRPVYNDEPGEQESWFHADCFGHRAEKLLGQSHVKEGTFLVRYSFTLPGECFSLSVRVATFQGNQQAVKHIRIAKMRNQKQDGWYLQGMPSIIGGSLSDLINKYQDEPFVDDSRNAIKINKNYAQKYARNTSIVHARNIDRHLKKITEARVVDDANPYFLGAETTDLEEEYEMIQEYDKGQQMFDPSLRSNRSTNSAQDPENSKKNRYANILPYDWSRVVLKYGKHYKDPKMQLSEEYVNANFIGRWGTQNRGRTYIACQGPLDGESVRKNNKKETITDFWRTIVSRQVRMIIMATNLVENAQPKCGKYWPEPGETKIIKQDGEPIIRVEGMMDKVDDTDIYIERKFFVSPLLLDQIGDAEFQDGWEVTQYQFKKWPDHGVLQQPHYIIDFLQKIHSKYEITDQVNQEIRQKLNDGSLRSADKQKVKTTRQAIAERIRKDMENKLDNLGSEGGAGPLLVHCSAGVGRTGTFIAIDMLMDRLRWFGLDSEIDVQATVHHLRSYRGSMVQSLEQYEFIYKALKAHIQGLIIRNSPDPTERYHKQKSLASENLNFEMRSRAGTTIRRK